MSENYNIKIGVDARSGERGVKTFSSALGDALKVLREFDKRSRSAFDTLSKIGNVNITNLAKQARGTAQAIETLNRVKISKSLVNNLQMLQRALQMRFNADALKKVPEAMAALSRMKIDTRFISTLNDIKTSLKGFRGPPAGVDKWRSILAALAKISVASSLPARMAALAVALRGFKGPSSSATKLPAFLRQIAAIRISPTLANNLATLNTATSGFRGPSATAARNLGTLLTVMQNANASQIRAVAAALARLNGLNLNISRGLSRMGSQGSGAFMNMGRSIANTTSALRGLGNQMSITSHLATVLSTALGSISLGAMVSGIYQTGNAFINLERTLGAVATSSGEVEAHMDFLQGLTTRMPVSLQAAALSYGKFAVAARLSGVSVQDTQRVFEGFSTAFAAMGVAAENQKYAFLALEQIFSKGTVSMEELRVQLGDHLPAAVQLLADSLGVPTAKLLKMIEAGEVTSDSLLKMADTVKNQFAPALKAAMNSSGAQIINLQNEWTNFKKTIFDSGFNAGLGAMAKQFSNILKSEDMQQFARDVGRAAGEVFKTIGAIGQVLAENRDKVILFFKAFAGYMVLYSAAAVLNMLLAPVRALGPALLILGGAFNGLRTAMAFLVGGKAITGVMNFFKSFSGKVLGTMVAILALSAVFDYLLTQFDKLAGTSLGGNFEALFKGLDAMTTAMAAKFGVLKEEITSGFDIDFGFKKAMADADEYYKLIQDADLTNEENIKKNAEREKRVLDAKAAALTTAEQKVWDEVNAVGKANSEYLAQLKLLDEIARKKGIDPAPYKEILAAQTLDERDPVGALVRDYREEIASIKAKTGEQKAFNDAKRDEASLLKDGIKLSNEQFDALRQYHEGIARMNGEIGSGFERWAAKVGDFNDNMQEAIADGIGGLADEITNFVTGAEADFAGLARSILASFVKISLESMMKDLFGAMGMDGEKNGASQAEQALAKLASIGENITTAQTNVYTNGLSINGQPVGDGSMANSPELPGAREAQRRETMTLADQYASYGAGKVGGKPNSGMSLADQYASYGAGKVMTDRGWGPDGPLGAKTTEKTNRIGYVDPERFAPNISPSGLALRGTIDPMATSSLAPTAPAASRFGRNISLSPQEIIDLKKTVATEWVQSAGTGQGQGIIDTILNRKASGKWGDSITDVVNAKSQFSDINGRPAWQKGRNSVDDLPMSRIDARTNALVDQHLSARAGGAPSSIGDHLNYANPYYSDKKNLGWINALDGPTLGRGKAIHKHGTTPGLMGARPGEFGVELPGQAQQATIDPATTGSITALNQKIATIGQTAQQAAPQMDVMKTKLTETGTSAQTGAQTAAMANQQRLMGDQQMGMSAASVGVQVQTAGSQAAMAGPQFQQAGTAMVSAGQQAAMAGQTAQSAQPGLGGFGQGISSLLGPLASAIPGLGQFGGMIMQLIQQMMMGGAGGGGLLGGLFKEGGYSDSPVSRARVGAGSFANAPHFREGTANTSGIPAVLHDNEAVIPLSRGRKVPIEMPDDKNPMYGAGAGGSRGGRPSMVFNFNGVKDADTFRRSKSQIASEIASAHRRAAMRDS